MRIVENESWRGLSAARQDQVEGALCLVAGARVGTVPRLVEAITERGAGGASDTGFVYVFAIALPAEEPRAPALVRALEKAMPFERPFGLVLLLLGSEGFSPHTLQDAFWVDVLDDLYDISVPTAVTVWAGGNAAVEGFQLAAQVSGLFRELDSLTELASLATLLSSLEERVREQDKDLATLARSSRGGGPT